MEQTVFLLCFLNLNIQIQFVKKTKDISPFLEVLRELWHIFQGHKLLKDWLIPIMLLIPECAHIKKSRKEIQGVWQLSASAPGIVHGLHHKQAEK